MSEKNLKILKCEVVLLQLQNYHDQSREPPGILCVYFKMIKANASSRQRLNFTPYVHGSRWFWKVE